MAEDPAKEAPTPNDKSAPPLQIHTHGTSSNLFGPLLILFLGIIIFIIVIALFWHIFHRPDLFPPGE
ncbi:MAG TPA: hypothetical protein VHB51_04265 [Candidatus Saccharimonadales bacterium]|nr:hypothetical protein [Candidatus Saccharimonadales bacterium]